MRLSCPLARLRERAGVRVNAASVRALCFFLVALSLPRSLNLFFRYFPVPGSAPRRRSHFHLSCQMKVTKAKAFMRQNSLCALRARRSNSRRKSVLGRWLLRPAAQQRFCARALLVLPPLPLAGEGRGEGECGPCLCALLVLVALSLLCSLNLLFLYFPEPGSAPRRRSHFHLSCQMKVTKAKALVRRNSLCALRARRSNIRRKSVFGGGGCCVLRRSSGAVRALCWSCSLSRLRERVGVRALRRNHISIIASVCNLGRLFGRWQV